MSFRFFELPIWVDTGTDSAERPSPVATLTKAYRGTSPSEVPLYGAAETAAP